MEFPVIIIDSTTNSIKDSEDDDDDEEEEEEEEEETGYLSPSARDDYKFLMRNSLQIQNKSNDDGDSGIHGSSEVLGPSPVPSHKLLPDNIIVDYRTTTNLKKTALSLSASSLLERKRSFTKSYVKQTKTRNFSIDTGRPSTIQTKQFSPYKLMILDENGQPFYVQPVNRDSIKTIMSRPSSLPINKMITEPSRQQKREQFVNSLCQIQFLLIIMKIVLGTSITVFGLFLKGFSSSLEMKDCGYWASSLLLVSGLFSIYFASENFYFLNRKIHQIYTIWVIILSCFSSILCLMASIHSGVHGNWISFHADECEFKTDIKENMMENNLQICCLNYPVKSTIQWFLNCTFARNVLQNQTNIKACGCFNHNEILQRLYVGLTCKYLFSSLKDHFVLICSLMGVGSGCDLWFLFYLFKNVCKNRTNSEFETKRSRVSSTAEQSASDINNKYLPSPLIPAVTMKSANHV